MFEIKIIGLDMMAKAIENLADAIKVFASKEAKKEEINLTLDGSVVEQSVKEAKNEAPTASKPVEEKTVETKEGAGEQEDEQSTKEDIPEDKAEPTVTLEEVRSKGTELARAGKRDLVKKVLEAAGASKLSDVPEDKLRYVMQCFAKGKVM